MIQGSYAGGPLFSAPSSGFFMTSSIRAERSSETPGGSRFFPACADYSRVVNSPPGLMLTEITFSGDRYHSKETSQFSDEHSSETSSSPRKTSLTVMSGMLFVLLWVFPPGQSGRISFRRTSFIHGNAFPFFRLFSGFFVA